MAREKVEPAGKSTIFLRGLSSTTQANFNILVIKSKLTQAEYFAVMVDKLITLEEIITKQV